MSTNSTLTIDRLLTDIVGSVDVALQDTTPQQLIAAYNSLVDEADHKKKFASKEKGLDAIWAVLDSKPIHVKAQKVLDVSEAIGFKIKAEKLTALKQALVDYVPPVVAVPAAAAKATKAAPAAKGAKKEAAPKKSGGTASGRTGELIGHFQKGNSRHVDDLAKLMSTTVQTVRNTIDAARRGNHIIVSQGKGVFLYTDPSGKKTEAAPAAPEPVAAKPEKPAKPAKGKKGAPVAEAAAPAPEAPSEPAPEPVGEQVTAEAPEEPLNISQGDDAVEEETTEA